MPDTSDPLVSVVTPVFNGAKYLAECIESVLEQTYRHWEYVIVNNCSTDGTLEIAKTYAAREPRIRLIDNRRFVSGIENHHIAFSQISPRSSYCKVVSADDWITPRCVSRLIAIAEAYPTVGIVGSYQARGGDVLWTGLPPTVEFITGREICRKALLDGLTVFGNPTSNLFRSELVRGETPFFPHLRPHADTSAAFECLQRWDFGFVHEVLSAERVHDHQVSIGVRDLNFLACLESVLTYGPIYLTEREFDLVKSRSVDQYYEWLGGCVLKLKGKAFWDGQASGMQDLGYRLSWNRILRCAVKEFGREIRDPAIAFQKVIVALKDLARRSARSRHRTPTR
jgi:glycosyltransferase involved in cell wall biosynthesis